MLIENVALTQSSMQNAQIERRPADAPIQVSNSTMDMHIKTEKE